MSTELYKVCSMSTELYEVQYAKLHVRGKSLMTFWNYASTEM